MTKARIDCRTNSEARRMHGQRIDGLKNVRHNGGKLVVAEVTDTMSFEKWANAAHEVEAYEIVDT